MLKKNSKVFQGPCIKSYKVLFKSMNGGVVLCRVYERER